MFLCQSSREYCCLALGSLWLHALNILREIKALQSQLVSSSVIVTTLHCNSDIALWKVILFQPLFYFLLLIPDLYNIYIPNPKDFSVDVLPYMHFPLEISFNIHLNFHFHPLYSLCPSCNCTSFAPPLPLTFSVGSNTRNSSFCLF